MLLSLTTLRVWQLGQRLAVEELVMYLFLAVAGLVALVLYMQKVDGPIGCYWIGSYRVTQAVLQIKQLDIAALRRAKEQG